MARIIFLNGVGSSGKSSIARSIQHLSDLDWLTFGVDTFISMTPYPASTKPGSEYFRFVQDMNDRGPSISVETTNKGDRFFSLMPNFAKFLADSGQNLVIDEVLFGDKRLKEYARALSGHQTFLIGVFCELAQLQEREILRQDRVVGLSNGQYDVVHNGCRPYDLKVDSTNNSSFELAKEVLKYCEQHEPSAFLKLQSDGQAE